MNRYESYKDSGVEWLGEIPSHWDIRRIKYLFNIGRGRVISQQELDDNGIYPVYSSQTLNNGVLGYISTYDFDCKQLTWTTDGANAGTIFLRSGKHSCTNVCGTLQPVRNESLEFIYYALSMSAQFYKRPDTNGAKIMNGEMADIFISYPPLSEQQKIAEYLDDKTAKIDQAIMLEEKQIELLKEHKQILIQDAVTKGLNPHVKFKHSGVEWIGEVPEHWEVKRFRNIFSFSKGLNITKENLEDNGIPCVNYGEIHSKYGFEVIPERDSLKCVDEKYLVFDKSILNKGDFVFADTSEDISGSGNFTYLNSDMKIFAGYHTLIARLKLDSHYRYIAYFFDCLSFRNQIRNKVKGVKVFSITQSILKDTFVLLPDLESQYQIADYLDQQTAKIDHAIQLKQQQIDKLKEYKTVLINDVVTGKMKVT